MDWGSQNVTSSTDQSAVRTNTSVAMMTFYQGTYYGKSAAGPLLTDNLVSYVFSGWIRTGTPYQLVGWLGGGSYLGVTTYGFTSLAPSASITGSSGFNLATANTQAEILNRMPTGSGANIGFIYDASVGTYGRVTWISQF